MTEQSPSSGSSATSAQPSGRRRHSVPAWLRGLGSRSWLFVGMVAAASIVFAALAALSGLVIPLVIAAVFAVLLGPVVGALERFRLPRKPAAALIMVGVAAIAAFSVWLAVTGVVDQGAEISRQVAAGIDRINEYLADAGFAGEDGSRALDGVVDFVPDIAKGLAGYVTSVFSSAVSFLVGIFVSAFFLYYLLADWDQLVGWFAGHLGVPADLGTPIIDDTMAAIRQYFTGLTISSLIVSVVIGVTMWILGLPLGLTVALVTFVTGYIPYLGALFSGAFAFLVAMGSGGIEKAVIVLAVVLVAQNVIQTLVQNKLTSDQLRIHPIVNFGSTIIGITLAGVLGATLSAPIVASLVRMFGRVRDYKWDLPVEP